MTAEIPERCSFVVPPDDLFPTVDDPWEFIVPDESGLIKVLATDDNMILCPADANVMLVTAENNLLLVPPKVVPCC